MYGRCCGYKVVLCCVLFVAFFGLCGVLMRGMGSCEVSYKSEVYQSLGAPQLLVL